MTQHSNGNTIIFSNNEDFTEFLHILETAKNTYEVTIHGFVLLKDHFHLLVETPLANISEFMRNVGIRYTSHFNKTHKRKGHLFAGRFKSVIIEKDPYLTSVSQYLHLNPVRKGTIKRKSQEDKAEFLSQWKWSSLPGFMGIYPRYTFVDHSSVLQAYGGDTPQGRQSYKESLFTRIDKGIELKSKIIAQVILGSIPFIEKMRLHLSPNHKERELPELRKMTNYLLQEKILAELENGLQCTREELLHFPTDNRAITMDMLYRFGGLTNPEIGDAMSLDYSSVSIGRKRIQSKRTSDLRLDAKMTLLEKRLQRLRNNSIRA